MIDGIRALTLTQPWASLMVAGHKTIETRSWSTTYRGPLIIHAAKGFPPAAKEFASVERAIGRIPAQIPLAAALAVVELVDVLPTEVAELDAGPVDRHLGDFTAGRYAWLTDRARLYVFPQPIPCSGRLGLWRPPEEVVLAAAATIAQR